MSPTSPGQPVQEAVDAVATRQQRRRRHVVAIVAGLVAVVGVAGPVIVVMVSRTSSASFADSEVLSANQLGAATLDIEIDPTAQGADAGSGDRDGIGGEPVGEALFSATNMAPGDRISGQLEMTNAGDVPLRYGLEAVGDGGVLEPWMRFEVWAATGICSPDQPGLRVVEDVRVGLRSVPLVELDRPDGANVLQPGESFVWCVGATLPLETPNVAQGQRLDLTLIVPAEQVVEDGQ